MGQIKVEQLLVAKEDQPCEVCLTLYSEEFCEDLTERILNLLIPEIGTWEYKAAFRLPTANDNSSYQQKTYKATEPPEQFQSIFLFFIRPDLTTKTLAIQLIVSVLGHPTEGWKLAANWLHHAWLRLSEKLNEGYLGYSVAYQASIAYDEKKAPAIGEDLLSSLWWIHRHEPNPMLATKNGQRVSASGWMWLVTYPSSSEEGIIYLVLGRDKQSKHLANQAYATRSSLLCSIDAFTHKSLRQGLELKEIYTNYEKSIVKPLQAAVHQLLLNASNTDELESMAKQIGPYADFCWQVDQLLYSLKQQISGINRLYLVDPMSAIASYHLLLVKVYEEDAQAIAVKNKATLEIARTALSMAEAAETKRANRKQERFNLLITFVATFLAADQILDTEFAKELLTLISFKMPTVSMSKPPHITEDIAVISYWSVFWSRIVSALCLTGIIFGIGWLIRRNRKAK